MQYLVLSLCYDKQFPFEYHVNVYDLISLNLKAMTVATLINIIMLKLSKK